jgi:hypothetical protein
MVRGFVPSMISQKKIKKKGRRYIIASTLQSIYIKKIQTNQAGELPIIY